MKEAEAAPGDVVESSSEDEDQELNLLHALHEEAGKPNSEPEFQAREAVDGVVGGSQREAHEPAGLASKLAIRVDEKSRSSVEDGAEVVPASVPLGVVNVEPVKAVWPGSTRDVSGGRVQPPQIPLPVARRGGSMWKSLVSWTALLSLIVRHTRQNDSCPRVRLPVSWYRPHFSMGLGRVGFGHFIFHALPVPP